MSTATPDRLPIGQLLVRHLRLFRERALELATEAGTDFELRMPHLHVLANMRRGGGRPTELAAAAGVTRPPMLAPLDEPEDQGPLGRPAHPPDKPAQPVAPPPPR